jgi:ABC-2 type transport system permease protein
MDFVGDTTKIEKTPLLLTSSSTHVQTIPSIVSMDIINVEKTGYYFNIRNMMTAALLEGQFTSIFKNRMVPEGIQATTAKKDSSVPTKMIVVADADVIRNDVQGYGANAQVLPLGYDQYMNQQFGNSDFLLNSVNYLTDDDGWMQLRNREVKLRLLNKASSIGARQFWQILNVLLPVLLLGIFAAIYLFLRKKKYTH